MVTTGKKAAMIISASVLLQLLLPVVLSLGIIVVHHIQHQRILSNAHDLSNFQRIVLSPTDTIIGGSELKINGALYDVAVVKVEHGTRVAYVLADENETTLFKIIPDQHKTKHNNYSVVPFAFLYHEQHVQWSLQYIPEYILKHKENYSPSSCSYHGTISLPPPRFC
jgi:hypothetical protein